MDPDAFSNVARGTAATCASASLAASVYGTVIGKNIGVMALASAIRGSVTGATFFSIREFVISPLLVSTLKTPQYVRRRQEIEGVGRSGSDPRQQHSHRLSWSEMRMHKLLDSTISGAFAGGILYSWQRGSARFAMSGATTAGLTCALLQLAYNEVHVRHVKSVTRDIEQAQHSPEPTQEKEPRRPFGERFFEALGMPKVSDEEFLQRLRVKRDGALKRIAEIEAQREVEKAKALQEGNQNHNSDGLPNAG